MIYLYNHYLKCIINKHFNNKIVKIATVNGEVIILYENGDLIFYDKNLTKKNIISNIINLLPYLYQSDGNDYIFYQTDFKIKNMNKFQLSIGKVKNTVDRTPSDIFLLINHILYTINPNGYFKQVSNHKIKNVSGNRYGFYQIL